MITIETIKESLKEKEFYFDSPVEIELVNLAIQLDSENTKLKAEIATLKRQLNNSTAYGS